jgi:hypothetical protein
LRYLFKDESVLLRRLTHTFNKIIDKDNTLPIDFARTTYFLNGCHESLKFKQAPFLKASVSNQFVGAIPSLFAIWQGRSSPAPNQNA